MASYRLTRVVTFKRIKADATVGDDGQVNEEIAANWQSLGTRRAECKQESSTESQGQEQQHSVAGWKVVVRGDSLTRSITHRDRMEFSGISTNITSIKLVQDVPPYLEFIGLE